MNKFHYLLMILITIYLIVMYDSPIPVLLLLLELLFPVLQWLLILPVRKRLHVRFEALEAVYEVGSKLPVELVIENPTVIPIANLQLELIIENQLTTETETLTLSTIVPAKGAVQMPLAVTTRYCGRVRVRVTTFCVWDFLQLLSLRRKIDVLKTSLVIPSLEPLSMEISNQVKTFLADCDEYDSHEKGHDPTEVFDIREYQPGDRLQQVHWKLSAARDTLLVKELSKPILYPAVLMLAVQKAEPWKMERMFTAYISLAWTMVLSGCPCCLVFRDAEGNLQKLSMRSEEELLPCVERLFSGCGMEEGRSMLAEFGELFPGEQFAHCLYITDCAEAELAEQLYAFSLAQRRTVIAAVDRLRAERTELFEEFGIELVQETETTEAVRQKHWII